MKPHNRTHRGRYIALIAFSLLGAPVTLVPGAARPQMGTAYTAVHLQSNGLTESAAHAIAAGPRLGGAIDPRQPDYPLRAMVWPVSAATAVDVTAGSSWGALITAGYRFSPMPGQRWERARRAIEGNLNAHIPES